MVAQHSSADVHRSLTAAKEDVKAAPGLFAQLEQSMKADGEMLVKKVKVDLANGAGM